MSKPKKSYFSNPLIKDSVVNSYTYNLIYQITLLLVPLITTPFLSRVLGVERIGLFAYVSSIVNYFVLFSQFGLSQYGTRVVSRFRDNNEKSGEILIQIMVLRFVLSILCISVYIILVALTRDFNQVYFAMTTVLLANAIDITWFYQGSDKFKHLAIQNIIFKIAETICVVIFIKSADDLVKYIAIISVFAVGSQMLFWLRVVSLVKTYKISSKIIQHHLLGGASLLVPQLIVTGYTVADKVILGFLTNDVQLGLYSQSEKVVKIVVAFVTSASVVVMPRVAYLHANGNSNEVATILKNANKILNLFSFPAVFGLIAVSDTLANCFFGKEYSDAGKLIRIIAPVIYLIGISSLYGMQFLVPTNRTKEYIIATLAGSFVGVLLNVFLARSFMAVGTSIAVVVAEMTVAVAMRHFANKFLKDQNEFPWKILFSAVFMGLSVWYLDQYSDMTLKYLIAEVICGFIIFSAVLHIAKEEALITALGVIKTHFRTMGLRISEGRPLEK